MTDDDADGIFGAGFELDSDEEEKTVKEEEKEKRTFQSEQDFLQQKRSWIPKVETREELLRSVATLNPPKNKFDVLMLKSAAELLYFSKDYEASLKVGKRILDVAMNEETYIGSGDRAEVEILVEKCNRRINRQSTETVA